MCPPTHHFLTQTKSVFIDFTAQGESGIENNNILSLSLVLSAQLFIASVLLEPELGLTPMPSPAHHSYGTMGNCQASVHEEEGATGKDAEETVETELEDTPGPVCSSSLMDSPVDYQ